MRWLPLLVPLALLAGCSDPVAGDFERRADLPSCGRIDLQQGERWRAADPDAWDCLDEALRTGGEAELGLTYPTVEGDPIGRWYRVSGGRLEIYEDSTKDPHGSGEWTHQECPAPERLPRNVHDLGC
jgi:hypothetical protein